MRGVAHSPAFKAKMVEKMLRPDGPSAYALAVESNVAQSTLARWKHEALTIGGMSSKKKTTRTGKRKPLGSESKRGPQTPTVLRAGDGCVSV